MGIEKHAYVNGISGRSRWCQSFLRERMSRIHAQLGREVTIAKDRSVKINVPTSSQLRLLRDLLLDRRSGGTQFVPEHSLGESEPNVNCCITAHESPRIPDAPA